MNFDYMNLLRWEENPLQNTVILCNWRSQDKGFCNAGYFKQVHSAKPWRIALFSLKEPI